MCRHSLARRRSIGLLLVQLLLVVEGQSSPSRRQLFLRHKHEAGGADVAQEMENKTFFQEDIGQPTLDGKVLNLRSEVSSSGDVGQEAISPEAYQLCYEQLESVAVDNKVLPPQYLRFLYNFSEGSANYTSLAQLPANLYLLFYTTACSSGQDCLTQEPFISTHQQGLSFSLLNFFCEEVYTYIDTSVELSFEYSIRYNSEVIADDEISQCVSAATKNILYENFGCSTQMDVTYRQLDSTKIDDNSLVRGLKLVQPSIVTRDSTDSPDEACPYSVTSEVVFVNIRKFELCDLLVRCVCERTNDRISSHLPLQRVSCRPPPLIHHAVVLSRHRLLFLWVSSTHLLRKL